MQREDLISYYGQQIDKVRASKNPRARSWHHQWIQALELRLQRQMQWRLIVLEHGGGHGEGSAGV
jgi:hypothetical protein